MSDFPLMHRGHSVDGLRCFRSSRSQPVAMDRTGAGMGAPARRVSRY